MTTCQFSSSSREYYAIRGILAKQPKLNHRHEDILFEEASATVQCSYSIAAMKPARPTSAPPATCTWSAAPLLLLDAAEPEEEPEPEPEPEAAEPDEPPDADDPPPDVADALPDAGEDDPPVPEALLTTTVVELPTDATTIPVLLPRVTVWSPLDRPAGKRLTDVWPGGRAAMEVAAVPGFPTSVAAVPGLPTLVAADGMPVTTPRESVSVGNAVNGFEKDTEDALVTDADESLDCAKAAAAKMGAVKRTERILTVVVYCCWENPFSLLV